ncbi:hypothetical protein EJ04DRAFT_339310 [Polyplosphaeria fusca]|uniref:Uncharacterized protein n=1 Tax=Polyplosphaeria fusca TaxID=682080 RepID=A0A9P4UZC7_9PLEO|nr:hypothetical protein EJ04DRAFT_339310 [Polyplosphaeria fusca]
MRFYIFSLVSLGALTVAFAQDTTGPCNNTRGGPCDDVREATTCFASIGLGRRNPDTTAEASVYRCVDDQDAASGKKQVCECYGCDTVLEAWVKSQTTAVCSNSTVVSTARRFRA